MDNSELMLQAIKLKGRIGPDKRLEITESPVELPEGNVELILLYPQDNAIKNAEHLSPAMWPVLDGGRYIGGKLNREEIYDDNGR